MSEEKLQNKQEQIQDNEIITVDDTTTAENAKNEKIYTPQQRKQFKKFDEDEASKYDKMTDEEKAKYDYSFVRTIRKQLIRDAQDNVIGSRMYMTPLHSLQAGKVYTGGSVSLDIMDSFFQKNILGDPANKEMAKAYKEKQRQHAEMPVAEMLKDKYTDKLNDEPNAKTKGEALADDMSAIKNGLREAFMKYQKIRYDALGDPATNDDKAKQDGLQALVGFIPQIAANHSRLQAMLQGNEEERKYAVLALSEAWTQAANEYRMEIEDELKALTPEKLRKIAEDKREKAKAALHETENNAVQTLTEPHNAMGIVFMGAFCPPLLFVALLPILIPMIRTMMNRHEANLNMKKSDEQYSIIDERADISSGITVSQSVLRDYIIAGLDGESQKFMQSFNCKETAARLQTEKSIMEAHLGPLYHKWFEQRITVGSPEHQQYLADLSNALQGMKMDQEQYFKANKAQLDHKEKQIASLANIKENAIADMNASAMSKNSRKDDYFNVLDKMSTLLNETDSKTATLSGKLLSVIKAAGKDHNDIGIISAYQGANMDDIINQGTLKITEGLYKGDAASLSMAATMVYAKDALTREFKDIDMVNGKDASKYDKAFEDYCIGGQNGVKTYTGLDGKEYHVNCAAADLDMSLRLMFGYETAATKNTKEEAKSGIDYLTAAYCYDSGPNNEASFWPKLSKYDEIAKMGPDKLNKLQELTIAMSMSESYAAQITMAERNGDVGTLGMNKLKSLYLQSKQEIEQLTDTHNKDGLSKDDIKTFQTACDKLTLAEKPKVRDVNAQIEVAELELKNLNINAMTCVPDPKKSELLQKDIIEKAAQVQKQIGEKQKELDELKIRRDVEMSCECSALTGAKYADMAIKKEYVIANEAERVGSEHDVMKERMSKIKELYSKYAEKFTDTSSMTDIEKQQFFADMEKEFSPLQRAGDETCMNTAIEGIVRTQFETQDAAATLKRIEERTEQHNENPNLFSFNNEPSKQQQSSQISIDQPPDFEL